MLNSLKSCLINSHEIVYIRGPQMMNPPDSGDPLTLRFAMRLACLGFSEIFEQLLDGLKKNREGTGPVLCSVQGVDWTNNKKIL